MYSYFYFVKPFIIQFYALQLILKTYNLNKWKFIEEYVSVFFSCLSIKQSNWSKRFMN